MTIEQSRVVDWLGIEKGTGHVRLTVIDDLDWVDERRHLLLLQEKLNTSLAFIESGEVFQRLAEDVGREVEHSTPIKVYILAKFAVTREGEDFLDYAKSMFKAAGIDLIFKLVEVPG
ncbi:DUF6572 domain-containing protein [Polyangium jinanense]|uniref:Uncharacterized protein n=1 Tax=Polyangium jinanense TaxID=2829994 RepID=A0A9X3X448_9BACT|nr:DUF6572 domain-containing protein [Polyangium jinanense]MDC3954698.1 hypothetical protein [Polyangium jinanense]MDC3981001.1 hypothetical protein [Polyangium jinanense]